MPNANNAATDDRLIEALGAYYEARDTGKAFDVELFLSEFADVRTRLEDFLAGAECVERLGRCGIAVGGTFAGPPTIVGDYEIEEELGHGGMGVVYRAFQRSTRRHVALKMIRSENHPAVEAVDRFQVEIHAVAALDHPHIVPIYEVGKFDGRPFYTMKLLDGGSLYDRLDELQKAPREVARIVLTIVRALEETHARGILHRDVKPQNILLDAAGTAYLTDFGLAKLCDGNLALTKSLAALGSPHYMAPEQAGGRSKEITTATDVYGLGATLYALLTGRPPFETDSFFDVVHLIQTTEPEPPTKFNPAVPADLEVICLKCLRKERTGRYITCAELADDLQSYLRGEPIRARPVGRIGRAWHWCRRNRSIAALSAILACALVAGLATSIRFWRMAEARLAEMTLQKNRAESSYLLSRAALDQSVRLVIDDPELRKGPLEKVRLDILSAQLQFHEQFLREHGHEPAVAADLAASHLAMGRLANEIGKPNLALEHFEKALDVYEKLAHDDDLRHEYRRKAAACWNEIAAILDDRNDPPDVVEKAYGEARRRLERIIVAPGEEDAARLELAETFKNLGSLRRKTGRVTEAADLHRQSVALARAIWDRSKSGDSQQMLAGGLNELGYSYELLENPPEALAAYVEAKTLYLALLKSRPDDPGVLSDLAYAHSNVASILGRSDVEKALAEHRSAIRVWEQLAADHPQVEKYRVRLAETHNYLADCLWGGERFPEAEAAYSTALQMVDAIADPGSDATIARKIAAYARQGLGHVQLEQKRSEEAAVNFKQAVEIYADLARDFPQMNEALEMQIVVDDALANLYSQSEPASSREWIRRGIECRRQLLTLSPKNVVYQRSLAGALGRLVDMLGATGKNHETEQAAREAIEVYESLLATRPADLRVAQRIQYDLAGLHLKARQFDKAERAFRERVELCRARLERNPENRRSRARLIEALRDLGVFLEDYGTGETPQTLYTEAILVRRERLPAVTVDDPDSLARIRDELELGELSRLQNRPEAALSHFDDALAAFVRLGDPKMAESPTRKLAAEVYGHRAGVLSELGRHAEAVEDWDRALAVDFDAIPANQIGRATDLARLGRVDEAMAATDEVSFVTDVRPKLLRAASGVLALCAQGAIRDENRSRTCADRSLQLLQRAMERGYRNVRDLDSATELEIIRIRPEFKGLTVHLRATETLVR